jgi:uncharacterized protein YpmS
VEKVELMAQGKMENLELKAKIRAQNEEANQKANYQVISSSLQLIIQFMIINI